MVTNPNNTFTSLTHDEMVKKGQEKYNNADAQGKLYIQTDMGKVDKTLSDYKNINQALADKKDFMFCSIGTTGLNKKGTDEIMQICITRYTYDENEKAYKVADKPNNPNKNAKDRLLIIPRISDEALKIATASIGKELNGTGANKGYDIFKYGGFDRSKEDNGLGTTTKDYCDRPHDPQVWNKLAKFVNEFFERNKDAVYVGMNNAFTNKFFEPIGINMPENNCDIIEYIKEWDIVNNSNAPLNTNNTKYSLNEIIHQFDNIGLKCLNSDGQLYATTNKVDAMKSLLFDVIPYVLEKNKTQAKQDNPFEIATIGGETKATDTAPTQAQPGDTVIAVESKPVKKTDFSADMTAPTTTNKNTPALDSFSDVENKMADFETAVEKNDATKDINDKAEGITCYTNGTEKSSEGNSAPTISKEEADRILAKEKKLDEILDKLVNIFASIQDLSKENNKTLSEIGIRLEAVEKAVIKPTRAKKTVEDKTVENTTPTTEKAENKASDKSEEDKKATDGQTTATTPTKRRGRPPKSATPVAEEKPVEEPEVEKEEPEGPELE